MTRFFLSLILIFTLISSCSQAPEDPEVRAKRIGLQLRCPVCRGVPIADSPATLAQQMMSEVRQQIAAGKSDPEIYQYFQERYGEWILLRPKPTGLNWTIWVLPFLFLTGGAGFILFFVKRRERGS